MVTRAQHWINVPSEMSHTLTPSITTGYATLRLPLIVTFTYSGQITYLEQIVVTMTLHANGYRYDLDETDAFNQLVEDFYDLNYTFYNNRAKRGDISVTLTSPQGSTSTLLFNRPYDIVTTEGYLNWPFLSVLHWGENPNGQWSIRVYWKNSRGSARMSNISVSLYGVSRFSGTPTTVSATPTAVSATPTPVSNTAAGKIAVYNLFIVLAFMSGLLL